MPFDTIRCLQKALLSWDPHLETVLLIWVSVQSVVSQSHASEPNQMLSDQVCGVCESLIPWSHTSSASYVLYSVSLLLLCSVWEAAGVFFTCSYNSIRYVARSVPAQQLSASWLCALEGLSAPVIDFTWKFCFPQGHLAAHLCYITVFCAFPVSV